MEKTAYSQLELFSQTKEPGQVKTNFSSSFISFIWNYEKTILLIIAFIITGIVAFALGMDRGRRVAVSKFSNQFDMAEIPTVDSKQSAVKPQVKLPLSAGQKEIIENKVPAPIQGGTGSYTIQVASYQNNTYAQKEAGALKMKGFSPLITSKGKYIIVCVGNFPNQTTAKSLLSQLKKRYQDCYIRRL